MSIHSKSTCSLGLSGALLASMAIAAFSIGRPAWAQSDDSKAVNVANEVARMVTEATGVVGALQADINAGKAADKTSPDQLYAAFLARYAKAAGKSFEERGDGLEGEARKAFANSLRDTLTKFSPNMAKGGTDAFVPAFFRAQVLKRFNVQMGGKVQAYATTRETELINADWSVEKVMKGSPFAGDVAQLMKAGEPAQVTKRNGERQMVYYPMKLGAACVACHARSGINQKEGGFGGALVAEVWVK